MHSSRTNVCLVALIAIGLSFAPGSQRHAVAGPGDEPTLESGLELAHKLCKGCHVIDSGAANPVPIGIPTFRGIANKPGQTGQRIKEVLIQPHVPMPDMQLSNTEILSLIMYLESLRNDPAIPPLLTPSQPKPTYPTPS